MIVPGFLVKEVNIYSDSKLAVLKIKELFEEGYCIIASDFSDKGNRSWTKFFEMCLEDSIRTGTKDRILALQPYGWTMVKNDIHLKKRLKTYGFDKVKPTLSQIAFTEKGTMGLTYEKNGFTAAAKALMRMVRK